MIDVGHMQVNKLENLATGKAVDALLNYETVVQFNNQKLEVEQYNSLLQGYQHASVGLW
jgi:ABC-type transport system involved in Fe-S cluster assembly fused permease/ATPase subunit